MNEHTPGPWILGTDRRYPCEPCVDAIVDGVLWHVALCHPGAGPHEASAQANARLIVCAPELYECLRSALPALRAEYERLAASRTQGSAVEASALWEAQTRYDEACAVIEKVEGRRPVESPDGCTQARR
ncbi:MAG TPA: hypothetical protein VF193_06160 [Steroidobacter sp.]